jgi:hypothetical protein
MSLREITKEARGYSWWGNIRIYNDSFSKIESVGRENFEVILQKNS